MYDSGSQLDFSRLFLPYLMSSPVISDIKLAGGSDFATFRGDSTDSVIFFDTGSIFPELLMDSG